MDERFEYPLPMLSVDTDYIMIETKDRHEGRFKIKNTGGSVLAGRILSRSRSITFTPSEWEGNEALITYRFDPAPEDGWKPGDVLETCAIICSNGGEKKIPITIKLTVMAIATKENITIANIKDFYEYALAYPAQARRLFVDSEFYMLLLAVGFEYMEAYEILHKDMNRERALDNFFILAGLKKKTLLTVPKRLIEFTRRPNDTTMIYSSFMVQKSDLGFFEAPVTALHGAAWLSLSSDRLIESDFNEAGAAMVKFSIDPLRVKGRYAREVVRIGAEEPASPTSQSFSLLTDISTSQPSGQPPETNQVELVFRRLAPITFGLDREAYRFDDHGVIEVINNTGVDLLLELFCPDNYVRLQARKYFVGDRHTIPFDIRLSTLMTAQLMFRKLPFLRTAVEVKTVYRDKVIKKSLPLVVGEW